MSTNVIPDKYFSGAELNIIDPMAAVAVVATPALADERWGAWDVFSGSGRRSVALRRSSLEIGLPVDLRHGYDVRRRGHY